MKQKIETESYIVITLNEEEAKWLQGFIQNFPILIDAEEPEKHQQMRHNLYTILENFERHCGYKPKS